MDLTVEATLLIAAALVALGCGKYIDDFGKGGRFFMTAYAILVIVLMVIALVKQLF